MGEGGRSEPTPWSGRARGSGTGPASAASRKPLERPDSDGSRWRNRIEGGVGGGIEKRGGGGGGRGCEMGKEAAGVGDGEVGPAPSPWARGSTRARTGRSRYAHAPDGAITDWVVTDWTTTGWVITDWIITDWVSTNQVITDWVVAD